MTPSSAALALPALVAALLIDGGGYEPTSWGWATIAFAWLLAALLALGRPALSRLELSALGGLAGFAGFAALSGLWSASLPLTMFDTERLLLLALGLAALLLVGQRELVLPGIVAAAALVATWNLLSRPGAGPDSGSEAAPVGYANGIGLVAVVGLLLAAGLALERPAWRLPALAAAVPLAPALYLSESRGSWVALAGGLLAGLVLRSRLPGWVFSAAIAVSAALAAVAALAASDERSAYWRTAFGASRREPLLGSGAGTWARTWLEHRQIAFPARDAHGLYVEVLSELGPLGLALLMLALAAPLAAALRARRQPLVPAAAAAYVAFVVHAGVDWDLEQAGVALAGLACGAALLAAARTDAVTIPRAPALAVVAVVGIAGALAYAGNAFEAAGAGDLRAGRPAEALPALRRAARLAPWASEPWRLRGEAERALGDTAAARRSFEQGIERDAGDRELWLALARAGPEEERRRALERARRLDPLGGLTP